MMGVHEMRDTGVVQHMLFQIPCGINWSDFIWSAEIKTIDHVNQTNKTNKITWDENMNPKSTTCVVVYWVHGVSVNKVIDNIKLNYMSFCVTQLWSHYGSISIYTPDPNTPIIACMHKAVHRAHHTNHIPPTLWFMHTKRVDDMCDSVSYLIPIDVTTYQ